MVENFASPFGQKALATVPRVLGLCDRMEDSATYGCCDRTYWHYRLIDFPNARLQEAGLLFSLARDRDGDGANVFNAPAMTRWARAVWRFWLARRNGDGSAMEQYPNERCFCATSFTAAAFMETVLALDRPAEWEPELKQCETTMWWLVNNANPEVANQMAASLLALCGYAAVTGDSVFAGHAKKRRDSVLGLMNDDDVFPEYGGRDIGYQSITLSALTRSMIISGDGALESVIKRGIRSIEYGIDAYGNVDADKNSRRTQFVYPYAFAVFKSDVIHRIGAGLEENVTPNPTWLDDRYCVPFAIDYLFSSSELAHANDNEQTDRASAD